MSQVENGNTVKIHYTGKLDDGSVFDTSNGRDPLEFEVGAGKVIPGFEKEVMGMKLGDKKSFTIDPMEAYGPRRDELVAQVPKGDFPENMELEIGQELQVRQPDNSVIRVIVADLGEENVTLDANHPLAGQALTFEIELVEIA